MKFKYPKYIVDALAKDDWYNALGKGVPLGKHFTITKNGKAIKAKDLVDSPNIASWEK